MRLPFLQIANEVLDQVAPDMAVKLKCSEADAGWGVLRLFRWGLGRCPDDMPPSACDVVEGEDAAALIANAAGYRGDPEVYAKACESVRPAVIERLPDGIRLRGLDRYDAAWGRNNPELWKLYKSQRKLEQVSSETAPDLSGDCDKPPHQTQTQTQTQTQKETAATAPPPETDSSRAMGGLSVQAVAVGAQPERRDPESPGAPLRPETPAPGFTVEPPSTPPEQWLWRDFWRWAQCLRVKARLPPEKPPNDRAGSSWWSTALMVEGITPRGLMRGFERFGQSDHWETTDPPYPFRGFMSQWEQFTRLEGRNETHAN